MRPYPPWGRCQKHLWGEQVVEAPGRDRVTGGLCLARQGPPAGNRCMERRGAERRGGEVAQRGLRGWWQAACWEWLRPRR